MVEWEWGETKAAMIFCVGAVPFPALHTLHRLNSNPKAAIGTQHSRVSNTVLWKYQCLIQIRRIFPIY